MAIHAQSSCTLSTITDVEAVYTYYYLSDSTITVDEAPKDNINVPGASTITVISDGENYVWTLTEPQLDIEDDVIQTAVGQLYYIECVKFSDGTYDWGPLMTSSTYAAAKAAYNLSSQALTQAQAANAATALLGGHFMYGGSLGSSTPASARIIEQIKENNIDVSDNPSKWLHNVIIGSNGIELRYNEAIMAQLAANQSGNNTALKFYKPPTISGNTTTQGGLTMQLDTNGLSFYGSSQSTPDAQLTSVGLSITNGSIELANGTNAAIKISNSNFSRSINSINHNDLRMAIGNQFGVASNGTLYASNADISGKITVGSGSNVYTTDDVNPLEIGGRNLLSNSQTITKTWGKNNATISDGVATVTCVSSGDARIYQTSNNGYWEWKANQDYTVSVDAKASVSGLKFYFNAFGFSKFSSYIALTTDWKRYTWTVSATSVSSESGSISFFAKNGQSGTIQFKNPKFEYGNKATDWTPAPEDVQSEIDAKKSVHTVFTDYPTYTTGYYTDTYARWLTFAAETYTASWTITDASGIKVGDTVRMAGSVSDMSNATIYLVGIVTATNVNGNANRITVASRGLDTTIIDGGNIITNSIGANKIKVNEINIGSLAGTIGGRNLLRGTNTIIALGSTNTTRSWPSAGWYQSGTGTVTTGVSITDSPVPSFNTAIQLKSTDATKDVGIAQGGVPFVGGRNVTLSAWVKGTAGDRFRLQPVWAAAASSGGTVPEGGSKIFTIASDDDNKWVKYSYTNAVYYNHPASSELSSASNTSANAGYVVLVQAPVGHTILVVGVQLEYGDVATDWSPALEDPKDNENLLLDTQKMAGWYKGTSASISTLDEYGVATLTGTTASWTSNISSPTMRTTVLNGATLWLSFEYQANVATSCYMGIGGASDPEGRVNSATRTKYNGSTITLPVATNWSRYTGKFPFSTISQLSSGSGDVNSVFLQLYNRTDGSTLKIRKIKLEYGTSSSDWSPSPEEHKTYITRIDDAGIRIHPSNTMNNSVVINADGMEIFKGGTTDPYSVAKYGDTVRIGKEASGHTTIASSGMKVYGSDGAVELANIGYGIGTAQTGTADAPYCTLGTRPSGSTIGNYSFASGYNVTASGYVSHAEGLGTTASGYASHAGGNNTIASALSQTAIGMYNLEDALSLFIVGNGSSSERKNAFAVRKTGILEAENVMAYGECSTAAATVQKDVMVANGSFTLQKGATIAVKFTYANTATNPTLKVNNLAAVAIKRYGTTAAGTSAAASWNAASVVCFVYDGSYWQMCDYNNTTYSGMSDAEYQAGTSTTNRLITPARLKSAIKLWADLTCTQVTLPYTPTKNGLLLFAITPSTTGRVFVTLNNAVPTIVDGYQVTGGYVNGVVFVQKGQAVSAATSGNLGGITVYFVSAG